MFGIWIHKVVMVFCPEIAETDRRDNRLIIFVWETTEVVFKKMIFRQLFLKLNICLESMKYKQIYMNR